MATPLPTDPTFQSIVASFRSRLTKAELDDFKFCSLKDVQQTIVDIQARQDKRRETKNLSRILGFLEAMTQFGTVVEVFLNTSEILAFVWGPLKFLLLVASSWAESFDALLDAYQQIGEQIPLLLQYQNVFTKSAEMRGLLGMMYKDILEFHQQALRVFAKPTWRQLFRAVWKDFDSRFKHLLMNLQRHKALIESHANVLEIQAASTARELAEKAFQEADSARKDNQRIVVRTWLSARNVQLDHDVYTGVRESYPSTGLWVLQKTAIAAWHDNEHPSGSLVWIHGIPGAGKTVLASVIIEKSKSLPSTIVAYFYCKYKDQERNTFVAVFRAMILQLLAESEDSDLLQVLYERSVKSGERYLESQSLCTELLSIAVGSISKNISIHMIIDGLDECENKERKIIISEITKLLKKDPQPGRIRVMFVSQPETTIRSLLRTATIVRISESDNAKDIAEYTRPWCLEIQRQFKIDDEKRDLIRTLVCESAGGMFLFAKLVLQNLYSQVSQTQLYESLLPRRFPRGLNQAYGRIVERIKASENVAIRDQALTLLGWIVTAKRPLTWPEIQGAVSIDIEEQTVDFEGRSLVVDIGALCGSLVEKLPGDRIELIHTSARM
ncbi:hypothetical protein NA56DRAFT_393481 [Hyaloscypha hepaticicola]|uniref:Uncharacterized protein n=1 Tax=Hyaloscypha hepaticicola TaxID=2082293 RepID=A0A2J6PJR6_9HELO|nr:hypothetical protein NA56DRAFT_393481 [Hyaloscypha hepaticicola]